MELKTFLGNVFHDLPNEYYSKIEFDAYDNQTISYVKLSYYGYFLAVGFSNGEILFCDSETGTVNEKYNIYEHSNSINTICFSSDNKWVLSGDSSGFLLITDIENTRSIYKEDFKSSIVNAAFNYEDKNMCFVQTEKECYIINFTTNEKTIFNNVEVKYFTWSKRNGLVIFTSQNKLQIYNNNFECTDELDFSSIKLVKGMYLSSLDNKVVLMLYKSVIVVCFKDCKFEDEGLDTCIKIKLLEDEKIKCAIFDRNDEHIIFASKNNIVAYDIDTCNVKTRLTGPSDLINTLIFHTEQPVIYSICNSCIFVWTPTYLQDFSYYNPTFQNIDYNELYDEPEDLFDFKEFPDFDVIQLEKDEEIDILSENLTHDPNVLINLEVDIEGAVKSYEKTKLKSTETD